MKVEVTRADFNKAKKYITEGTGTCLVEAAIQRHTHLNCFVGYIVATIKRGDKWVKYTVDSKTTSKIEKFDEGGITSKNFKPFTVVLTKVN